MQRLTICCVLCAVATTCFAQELGRLPKPHYQQQPSDPPWLVQVVQLHGHLGPWVVAGARLGMAGALAVDAKTHFDVDVTCEGPFVKPPESCFLDGVQLGSGATLGKRNMHYIEAKQIALKIRNTRTGKMAEVRPTEKLLKLLMSPTPEPSKTDGNQSANKQAGEDHDEERVEQNARNIAEMPDKEILTISNP